jgi:SAM-dependent methyltransferase
MAERDALRGSAVYQEYRNSIRQTYGSEPAKYHLADFNLQEELAACQPDDRILDLGCGSDARAIAELQTQFPHLRFIGINPLLDRTPPNVLTFENSAEELDLLADDPEFAALLPFSRVIARNTFYTLGIAQHVPGQEGLRDLAEVAMQNIYPLVADDGSLLVYDYAGIIPNMYQSTAITGIKAGFEVAALPSLDGSNANAYRKTKHYLRFTKPKPTH